MKENKTRVFKGKLIDFKDKEERNFEKKHLKAYLRGDEFFEYGLDERGKPIIRKVQQEYIEPTILKA